VKEVGEGAIELDRFPKRVRRRSVDWGGAGKSKKIEGLSGKKTKQPGQKKMRLPGRKKKRPSSVLVNSKEDVLVLNSAVYFVRGSERGKGGENTGKQNSWRKKVLSVCDCWNKSSQEERRGDRQAEAEEVFFFGPYEARAK